MLRVACVLAAAFLAAAAERSPWLDVPFVRQEKNGCGAACLTMLIRYWKAHGARAQALLLGRAERLLYLAGPSPQTHAEPIALRFGARSVPIWSLEVPAGLHTSTVLVEVAVVAGLGFLAAARPGGRAAAGRPASRLAAARE